MVTNEIAKELGIELDRPFSVVYNGETPVSNFVFDSRGDFLNYDTGQRSKNMLTKLVFGDAVFNEYTPVKHEEITIKDLPPNYIPKIGETYWELSVQPSGSFLERQTIMTGSMWDAFNHYFGNMYRTRKELREDKKNISGVKKEMDERNEVG